MARPLTSTQDSHQPPLPTPTGRADIERGVEGVVFDQLEEPSQLVGLPHLHLRAGPGGELRRVGEAGHVADHRPLDKLLVEHDDPTRPPEPVDDLPAGTTVIVDEAGTAPTPKLAELARLADQQAWRVVLVGDPRQFSAVGRGGMFAHFVDTHGAVELDQVHRFRHGWERRASLRLRAGDPTVLSDYDRHGRLHGGTVEEMEADIITAWQQARSCGETVALMANRTDTVARLNHLAQQVRMTSGELDPDGPSLHVGDQRLLVGDEVVTRHNDRRLRTHLGVMVKNRDHWTITAIHPDHSVTLTGATGTIRLPADYVAEHLELGYAQTAHATQGRTVDVALLLLDTAVDHRGIYTPLTRGRHVNHAYVIVEDHETSADVLAQALGRDWIDQPAVVRRAQLDPDRVRQFPEPGDADHRADLQQRILRSVDRQRARTREAELAVERGPNLTIG